MTDTVATILSVLTVVANVFVVLAIVGWFAKKNVTVQKVAALIKRHGLWMLFVVPLIAMLGSLFYSEIAGYRPCLLCWYQRILMYPQVLLVGVALYRKSKEIVPYILTMSIVGACISAYHYIEQIKATIIPVDPTIPCGSEGVSCAVSYTFHFGYITIPMMALSAFLMIIAIGLMVKSSASKPRAHGSAGEAL